jgi:hypothetical protein
MIPSAEFPAKTQIFAITTRRHAPDPQMFVEILVNAVHSEHSRRAYAHAANEYLSWCDARNLRYFYKPTVQQYRAVIPKPLRCDRT